ncbi:MAG: hypothetical protein L0213_03530, partial [Candidatus Dadabacteria bacterium]|nr:hypothetical protein [Candidatus Dadabacteria bacterium]
KSAIIDKMSVVGRSCNIGEGNGSKPNGMQPDMLDFGITLVGRKTIIPGGTRIGTNCLVSGSARNGRVPRSDIEDGGSYVAPDLAI